MSDSKAVPRTLELITNTMNELAQEIGMMEVDDPRRSACLKELSVLTQLRRAVRLQDDQLLGQRLEELAREMTTLKAGDARRARLVEEIVRLSTLEK
jgi:hypothetical protein